MKLKCLLFNLIKLLQFQNESSAASDTNRETVSLSNLKYEFDQFKAFVGNEIQLLKNQNKIILNKIETFSDRIKSVKGIKKELTAFFSINGYSEALGTNSLFKKVFWFLTLSVLFASCMVMVARNVDGYRANEVVTQFKVIDDQNMIFPAVTFCIVEFDIQDYNMNSTSLNSRLNNCTFESKSCNGSSYLKPVQLTIYSQKFDCYSFNTGRNGLLSTNGVGTGTGLHIFFNLSQTEKLIFKIHDNNEEPTFVELNDIVEQEGGKIISVGMKKTIETKEPFPYSNCTQNINSDTSHFVRKIQQQNITYKQRNCFQRCFEEYFDRQYSSRNLTNKEAHQLYNQFDYQGNCSKMCPLECTSTTFDTIENEMDLNPSDPIHLFLNFFYHDRKYTEVTQSVKVTFADFTSNTGGVLGLFLELSFFSACRFIIFVFDLILV
jgi:hypothetical protein